MARRSRALAVLGSALAFGMLHHRLVAATLAGITYRSSRAVVAPSRMPSSHMRRPIVLSPSFPYSSGR
jgi:hypothetical protein